LLDRGGSERISSDKDDTHVIGFELRRIRQGSLSRGAVFGQPLVQMIVEFWRYC
jgi:hypothetical protein